MQVGLETESSSKQLKKLNPIQINRFGYDLVEWSLEMRRQFHRENWRTTVVVGEFKVGQTLNEGNNGVNVGVRPKRLGGWQTGGDGGRRRGGRWNMRS